MDLTKDADKVLCKLYKEYLLRLKSSNSKSSALRFDTKTLNIIFENQDIELETSELNDKSLIETWINGDILLKSDAIIYMEKRFKNNLTEITDFIAKFMP